MQGHNNSPHSPKYNSKLIQFNTEQRARRVSLFLVQTDIALAVRSKAFR